MNQVDRGLEKIHSVSVKLNALKEQIRIRVLGFGWYDIHTTWLYTLAVKSPKSLAVHLKTIIKEETSHPITNEPPSNLPSQKHVTTLGTFSKHVIVMDRFRSKIITSLNLLLENSSLYRDQWIW